MGLQGIYARTQATSLEQAMQKAARQRAEKEAAGKAEETGRTREALAALKAENGEKKQASRFDEYIPGDAAEPETRKQPEKAAEPEAGERPEKSEKAEKCVANTDEVDREIEKLKRKKEKLKEEIRTCEDEGKKEELEKKLTQVEAELRQKDNDSYRRQHTKFS